MVHGFGLVIFKYLLYLFRSCLNHLYLQYSGGIIVLIQDRCVGLHPTVPMKICSTEDSTAMLQNVVERFSKLHTSTLSKPYLFQYAF